MVRFPSGAVYVSCLQTVQTSTGAYSASYSVCTGRPFRPGVKRLEREANHLPSFSADLENEWSYVSAPLYALMACTKTRFSWYRDVAFSFSVGRYSKCISVFHGIRNRLLIWSSVCVRMRAPVSACVRNVGTGVRLFVLLLHGKWIMAHLQYRTGCEKFCDGGMAYCTPLACTHAWPILPHTAYCTGSSFVL